MLFYQTEASQEKQSQLLSAPAQITASTQAPQLEPAQTVGALCPAQTTPPISALAPGSLSLFSLPAP